MGARAGDPDPSSRTLELEITWEGDGVRLVLSEGDSPSPTVIQRRRKRADKALLQQVCDQIYSSLQAASHGRSHGGIALEEVRQEGRRLFDLLLDSDTQSDLVSTKASFLLLRIDDELVDIPWELLYDGHDFLSDRFALGRQVITEVQAPRADRMRESRPEPTVAVLGSSQESLKAVSKEGRGIHLALEDSPFQSDVNLEAYPEDFKRALREAEILHFCGHAEFDCEEPDQSRLVFEEGTGLTAEDIGESLAGAEQIPRLVFLNACGSGLSGNWSKDSAKAAFGLGNAFLLHGVEHVIVALGDVQDGSSAQLGEVFYRHLGRGETIGESLKQARVESGRDNPAGKSDVLYGLPQSSVRGERISHSHLESESETILKVFLFTDLVGSTDLKSRLGDSAAAKIFSKHDTLFRDCLSQFGGNEEKETGDGFLASFNLPSSAIRCALAFHRKLKGLDVSEKLHARMGLHMGEIIRVPDAEADSGHEKLVGLILDTTARVMDLALPDQILLTRGLFDSARQQLVADSEEHSIGWCAHGPFLIKGLEEPIEIFEVGIPEISPLRIPENTQKVRSAVAAGEEVTLGWRPAAGIEIPFRENWILEEKLGEGGFGEVWLSHHQKTKDRRVFKFCFEADRMRGLKREVTLFRLIKETLGDREDIVKLLDWNFEETPYFIETEYTSGGDLKTWAGEKGGLDQIPLETRLELIAQVADALAAAHSVGIIHKDVKARNILISTDLQAQPRAVLTDFGIGQIEDSNLLLAQGITATGVTRSTSTSPSDSGTRLYMAPEILEGKVGATTADIFSLGVLLYQVVCGDFSRALATGWERDVEDDFLREDIALCVDRLPERRIQTGIELANRLRNLQERRQQQEKQRRAREEEEQNKVLAAHQKRRQRVLLSSSLVGIVTAILLSVLAIHLARVAKNEKTARADAETQRESAIEESYYLSVALAGNAIEDRDFAEARDRLFSCPKQHRNWEWGRLQYLCNLDLKAYDENEGPVGSVDLSLNGRYLASTDWEGCAVVWDMETEDIVRKFKADNARFFISYFSYDPSRLFIAEFPYQLDEKYGVVGLWDIGTGQKLRTLGLPVTAAGISADRKRFVTGYENGTVSLWDSEGTELSNFPTSATQVFVLALDSRGDFLALGTRTGDIEVWDTRIEKRIQTLPRHSNTISILSFSPDGRYLSAASGDTVSVSDLHGTQPTVTLLGHTEEIRSVVFSPDGKHLATAGYDCTARLWNPRTGENLRTFEGHSGYVSDIVFLPNSSIIVTSGRDQKVRFWDTKIDGGVSILPGCEDKVTSLSFSPDGARLAAVGSSGWVDPQIPFVKVWDIKTATVVYADVEDAHGVMAASFNQMGELLGITLGVDGKGRCWEKTSERVVSKPIIHPDKASCISFHPDGSSFATGGRDGNVYIWDFKSGTLADEFELGDDPITCVTYSEDGCVLAAGNMTGSLGLWDLDSDRQLPSFFLGNELTTIVLSHEGDCLYCADRYGRTYVYDIAEGVVSASRQVTSDRILDLCEGTDGKRLVVSDDRGNLVILDSRTLRELITLPSGQGSGEAVAFRPEGRLLATSGKDNTVVLWPSFSWKEEDYSGERSTSLERRMEIYKRDYWTKHLASAF